MWNAQNIVTSVDGRQYLRTSNGTYVEIALQSAVPQLFSINAQQPSSTGKERQPTESQLFTANALQTNIVVQSQTMDGFLRQSNTADMQFVSDATLDTTATDHLISTAMPRDIESIKVDDAEGVYVSESDQQFQEIIQRLDRIEPVLEKLVFFMADVQRYMRMKSSSDQSDQVDNSKKRKIQDFSEYEGFFPIHTEDQLLTLESSLKNQAANDKLLDYFEYVYNLNGKRDNGPFFRTLMRKILIPTTIQAFSWKGQSRSTKGSVKTENKSFKDTFPTFVKFVHRVVRAADFEFTEEDNDDAFSNYLRNKNTEIQRHEKGAGEQRVARVRRNKAPKPVVPETDGSETTNTEVESYESLVSSTSSDKLL